MAPTTRPHRIQHPRRDRQRDQIVQRGPEEIQNDPSENHTTQRNQRHHAAQIRHEDETRRLHRDIRASSDSDANIRDGQGGRVVDPITDHGDGRAAALAAQQVLEADAAARQQGLLEEGNLARFLGGEHAGDDVVGWNSHFSADGVGCLRVVA